MTDHEKTIRTALEFAPEYTSREIIDAALKSLTALQEEREKMKAALKSGVSEECEGCEDPATHYDCEMVPLCDVCWEGLLRDSAADAAIGEPAAEEEVGKPLTVRTSGEGEAKPGLGLPPLSEEGE